MTSDEAEGTTETAACRFWMVSCTVTRRPFQLAVALAISSPTFLGDYRVKVSRKFEGSSCSATTYETQGTNLGSKGGRGSYFTTGSPEVDNFDLIGVLKKGIR